jgi:hypothetical protein
MNNISQRLMTEDYELFLWNAKIYGSSELRLLNLLEICGRRSTYVKIDDTIFCTPTHM